MGFQAPCTLLARPGNDASINAYKEPGLCGPLLALNPQLYDPELLEDPTQAGSKQGRGAGGGCGRALPRSMPPSLRPPPACSHPPAPDPAPPLLPGPGPQDVMIDKPQIGALGNSTTLVVAHAGLFERGTLVTITNTLGTCMLPCSSERVCGLHACMHACGGRRQLHIGP